MKEVSGGNLNFCLRMNIKCFSHRDCTGFPECPACAQIEADEFRCIPAL